MVSKRRRARGTAPVFFEPLENRQLLSSTLDANALSTESALLVPAAAQPSVTHTRPGAGETNVLRDTAIAADLNLPNAGIDESTLKSSTVKLYKTKTGSAVSVILNTTGGGDAIIAQPTSYLAPNTNYTFEVTSGLKDSSGARISVSGVRSSWEMLVKNWVFC